MSILSLKTTDNTGPAPGRGAASTGQAENAAPGRDAASTGQAENAALGRGAASTGQAENAAPGTRVFLVRHGQPEQHSGKIFLGQADVPLSTQGRREAAMAGEMLANLGAQPRRIYTSDLARAQETAEIIAERLGGVPVVPDKLLREMAMGIWDGELIEDIKAKFPDEYEKRGDDIRNYRTPGGENFYDLHGRVTREFHRIFAEDFRKNHPGDLVIVAHLGVLTVLSEELLLEAAGDGIGRRTFSTGSVTVYGVPDWLRADKGDGSFCLADKGDGSFCLGDKKNRPPCPPVDDEGLSK